MTMPIEQPTATTGPIEEPSEVVTRLTDAFVRYAGWLGNDRPASAVRTHAQALGRAVEARADMSTWITLLDDDLKRLPSSEVRKMLRRTLTELSAAVESNVCKGGTEHSS